MHSTWALSGSRSSARSSPSTTSNGLVGRQFVQEAVVAPQGLGHLGVTVAGPRVEALAAARHRRRRRPWRTTWRRISSSAPNPVKSATGCSKVSDQRTVAAHRVGQVHRDPHRFLRGPHRRRAARRRRLRAPCGADRVGVGVLPAVGHQWADHPQTREAASGSAPATRSSPTATRRSTPLARWRSCTNRQHGTGRARRRRLVGYDGFGPGRRFGADEGRRRTGPVGIEIRIGCVAALVGVVAVEQLSRRAAPGPGRRRRSACPSFPVARARSGRPPAR